MKKKLISMLVFVLSICSFVAAANAAGVEDLTWEITDQGTVTITGHTDGIEGDLIIPEYIDGYPVTKIADFCFERTNLTGVKMPDSIVSVGMDVFYRCFELEWVDFSENVTWLNGCMFSSCSSLKEVDLPDHATHMGNDFFKNCTSLRNVDLPDTLVKIDSYAFAGCTELEYIDLPKTLVKLGSSVFSDCTSLTSVYIPEGVTSIESFTFAGCTNLRSVRIASTVKSIQYRAFWNCSSLETVIIPEGVELLSNGIFDGCTSLSAIFLPESVIEIGNGFSLGFDPENVCLYCVPYSYAHYYAYENGYDYELYLSTFEDDNKQGTWTWASEYIYNCVNNGLITGYPDGTFLPDKSITRAEFVSILYKTYLALGGESISEGHPFQDAPASWYQAALNWAYWTGVVTGTSDTTFSPNATITRQEMATIMYRFMNTFFELEDTVYDDLSGYDDRNAVASWAKEGVRFCVTYGIINGTGAKTLSPTSSATRAQAATIISRTFIA